MLRICRPTATPMLMPVKTRLRLPAMLSLSAMMSPPPTSTCKAARKRLLEWVSHLDRCIQAAHVIHQAFHNPERSASEGSGEHTNATPASKSSRKPSTHVAPQMPSTPAQAVLTSAGVGELTRILALLFLHLTAVSGSSAASQKSVRPRRVFVNAVAGNILGLF
jgi:hypothetical protein